MAADILFALISSHTKYFYSYEISKIEPDAVNK